MGYTYYSRMIMIPASITIDFDSIQASLEEMYLPSNPTVVTRPHPNKIEIKFRNEWTYHIAWVEQPEDIAEIAELFAKEREDKDIIASASTIMSIWGDPDPDTNYFNEYVDIISELEAIPDIYHFDNYDGKLWKSGEDPYKSKDDSTNQNP